MWPSGAAPLDFRLGFELLLPHAQRLQRGARLLALESHVRAHQRDADGAARSIHAIFMTARSLEREPIMASQYVRMAIDGTAVEQIERILPTVELSDRDLLQLQADLWATRYGEDLRRSMAGERAMVIEFFRNPRDDALSPLDDKMGPLDEVLWRITRQADFSLYLRTTGRAVAAAQQAWPQAIRAAQRIESEVDNKTSGGAAWAKARYHGMSVLRLPVSGAFTLVARSTARKDAAELAIALERYRRRNGALPENLE